MKVIFTKKNFKTSILLCFINMFFVQFAYASNFITANWHTKNGANVVLYETKSVDMLEIQIAFKAGSAYDGDNFGLSALTTSLLNKGNRNFDTNQLAEEIASTGAQYSYHITRDMTILNLRTLIEPAPLNKSIDLLSLIINEPNFNYQSFLREKNQQLMEIAQIKESPTEVANHAFFKALYKNHPYAHPINGTDTSVKEITRDNVINFYNKYFTAKNATIVMVGAINEAKAKQIAENLVKGLKPGKVAEKIVAPPPLKKEENFAIKFPSSQTILRVGQIGVDFHNPEYFPLLIGNYILGGPNLVSRLSSEIRDKRGLTYGVYSQFVPMLGDGPFLIGLATKNVNAIESSTIIREILESFIHSGPTDEEVNNAKQYLTGSFPLALASNHSIATMLLKIIFYKLPNDYLDTYVSKVNAVTTQEIKKALQDVIQPDKLLQIAVGGS